MGVKFTDLYNEMYKTKEKIARLNGYILQNFTMVEEGAAYIKLTKEVLEEFDVLPSEASGVVGALGNIDGLKAWVLFLEEDDVIRVRLRSKGPVINKLAMQYNGGGHPMASGAKASSWEEADRLLLIYVRFVNKRLYVRTKRRSGAKALLLYFSFYSNANFKHCIKRYCIDFKTV